MSANASVLRARRRPAAQREESLVEREWRLQQRRLLLSSKSSKDLSSKHLEKCWERFVQKAISLFKYKALASFGRPLYHGISCDSGASPQSRPRLLRGSFVGSPMDPESKGKHDGIDPALCPHEDKKMKPRGNTWKKWWTCTGCGSRWGRVSPADTKEVSEEAGIPTDDEFYSAEEYVIERVIYDAEEEQKPPCERETLCKKGKDWWNSVTPDEIPREDDKMTFGMYKGYFTCQEVFEKDKGYCEWVISKGLGGPCSRELLLFAHFIMRREWGSCGSNMLGGYSHLRVDSRIPGTNSLIRRSCGY